MHQRILALSCLLMFISTLTITEATETVRSQFPDSSFITANCSNISFNMTTYQAFDWVVSYGTCSRSTSSIMIASFQSISDLKSRCNGDIQIIDYAGNTTYIANFKVSISLNGKIVSDDNYDVKCVYNNILLSDEPSGYNVTIRQSGYASANGSMSNGNKVVMTTSSSLYKLGEVVTLQISGDNSLLPSITLAASPMNCYSTSDGINANKYYLVSDRCPSDPTCTVQQTSNRSMDVSFEAYKYKNLESSRVYLHCEILLCLSTGSVDPRCQGCPNKKRRRRSILTDGKDFKVMTVGPIEIVNPEQAIVKHMVSSKSKHKNVPIRHHYGNKSHKSVERVNKMILVVLFATLFHVVFGSTVKRIYDQKFVKESIGKIEIHTKGYTPLKTF